ncbi:protein ripply2 isoform X2 [Castor canadensis]|uniref:Protein ripply2 isoform X2 n=1 Tax=Castor canadensis TaxID=51338 RepID=A0AC58MZK2_CASCN
METAERTQSAESGAPKPGRVGRPLPRVPDGQAQRSDAESGYSSSTRSKHPSQALLLTSPAPPLRSPPHAWAQMLLGFGGFSLVGLTTPPHRLCSPSRRSARFWRPWVKAPGEKEEGTPHRAVEAMPNGPGMTGASGKLCQYRHPTILAKVKVLRLFISRSRSSSEKFSNSSYNFIL